MCFFLSLTKDGTRDGKARRLLWRGIVMATRQAVYVFALGMLTVVGCLSPVQRDVDALVSNRAGQEMDVAAAGFLVPAQLPKPRPPIDLTKPPSLLQRLELPDAIPGSDSPKIVLPKDFEKLPVKEKQAAL